MAERKLGTAYLSYKGSTPVISFYLKFLKWIGTEVLSQEILSNIIMENGSSV